MRHHEDDVSAQPKPCVCLHGPCEGECGYDPAAPEDPALAAFDGARFRPPLSEAESKCLMALTIEGAGGPFMSMQEVAVLVIECAEAEGVTPNPELVALAYPDGRR